MSQPPPPPSISRALLSRLLFGVTSIGAAIGVAYLFYSRQKNNDPPPTPDPAGTSATSSSALSRGKKKRMSSGERNRVTFSDQNEIICTGDGSHSPPPGQGQEDHKNSKDEIELDGNNLAAELARVESNAEDETFEKIVADLHAQQKATKTDNNSSLNVGQKPEMNLGDGNDPKTGSHPPDKVEVKEEIKQESISTANNSTNGHGHAFAQHGLTPETDYDRTGITKELQINRDHVPGLIGRKGTNIRAIQQNSNTLITFKDETLENGDRICQIRGQPQDVTVAESLIEKHILDQPVLTSATMYVPHSSVGRIIGKGGESIRGIQDMSKAKVNVDTGNQFHNRGGSDAVRMVTVTLRGTEEQIEFAKQMIIEKVDEEKALRRNIDIMTQNRAPRRPPGVSSPSSAAANNPSAAAANGNHSSSLPYIDRSGVLEVFVSCAYHPNDFWIQVMGRESILLDKLTEQMTEFYSAGGPDGLGFTVGEIIAAPFDVDGKMYRGKILKLDDETQSAEVCYVDYGDKRVINQSAIRRIHPEFLQIQFQAIQATLNLGCVGSEERWPDESIVAFCDLTYCAQWHSLTAKVKEYLKSGNDSMQTVLFVELFDKDLNIGNNLISRGLASATRNDPLVSSPFYDSSSFPNNLSASSSTSTSSAFNNSNKKSYASVVSKEQEDEERGNGSNSTMESGMDGPWEDNVNGN